MKCIENNEKCRETKTMISAEEMKCDYSGYCNDCRYYTTWNSQPWCDKNSHFIQSSNVEKDCYVSR